MGEQTGATAKQLWEAAVNNPRFHWRGGIEELAEQYAEYEAACISEVEEIARYLVPVGSAIVPDADRITPELRAALSRLRDDHRRFARIPGYHDGPIELGDWTLIHRAIDPAHAATSDGIPEPEGMLPDISDALRLVKAAHVATAEEQRTAAIVDAMYDKSGDAYTAALDVAVAANRIARRARGAVTDAHLAALDAFLGGRS